MRRLRSGSAEQEEMSSTSHPELVVVISELADISDDGTTLQVIASEGPAVGVRLVAATIRPEHVPAAALAHFGSRLVLRLPDEDQSVRLVGSTDAFLLDAGGEMLVRIDVRQPLQARGYRLAPERLDELVDSMTRAYEARGESQVPEQKGERVAEDVLPPATSEAEPIEAMDMQEPDVLGADDEEVEHVAGGEDVPKVSGDTVVQLALSAAPVEPPPPGPVPTTEGVGAIMEQVRGSVQERVGSDGQGDSEGPLRRAGVRIMAPGEARLQVYCFGGLRVTVGDREFSALGADGYVQNKALEMLAFLAAMAPEPVPRQKVVAALWPKGDDLRGGKALSATLSRLRALLSSQGEELEAGIEYRNRDGATRLDSRLIWSDVHQFLELVWEGRHSSPARAKERCEQALSLYRGSLLSGSRYGWIHEHDEGASLHDQYREEYRTVAKRLGDLHCNEGHPDLAVALYGRLLEAEPTLEDIACKLYHCYVMLGDRAAIVREHKQLKDNLRQLLYDPSDPDDDPDGYQPMAETVTTYAEALAQLDARVKPLTAG